MEHRLDSMRTRTPRRGAAVISPLPGAMQATLVAGLLLCGSASGSDMTPCFAQAGLRFGIAPELLCAIALAESGLDARASHQNANGSVDVGVMQVNSRWFAPLREYGLTPADLWEPCTNIHVGAWILAHDILRYGSTWTAVGAYNAGTGADAGTENAASAMRPRSSAICGSISPALPLCPEVPTPIHRTAPVRPFGPGRDPTCKPQP